MNLKLLNFLFGYTILQAEGLYTERILNIAKEEGIFISDIEKPKETILHFSVSSKGARHLLASPLPEGLSLKVIEEKGFVALVKSLKNRKIALFLPIFLSLVLFFSTCIIWNVNIVDCDVQMEKRLLEELSALGVKRGAFKFSIDQSFVKNQLLIRNNDLLWVWVDLKGASAIVKYAPRTLPPKVFDEKDFCNVYSSEDAIVTRVLATGGTARVREGDVVLKGGLLIEGVKTISETETAPTHATGEVYGLVWQTKEVNIYKKEEIRTPTGEKCEHLTINFLNFPIKLFINSSILYPEYDIIDYSRDFLFFPVSFNKKEYREVTVTYKDTDIEKLIENHKAVFYNELIQKGLSVDTIDIYSADMGDYLSITLKSLCEQPIGIERRINFGENYSGTDN